MVLLFHVHCNYDNVGVLFAAYGYKSIHVYLHLNIGILEVVTVKYIIKEAHVPTLSKCLLFTVNWCIRRKVR